ncbi:MAG: DUF362 domain-containing protein [Candidatus Pacearchaeota archaeon]|nr:DUF362 domain-containing protein [Candidatus Pacearchaeota archaeon]
MAKGISIKFQSYQTTIPKLLDLIGLGKELKKHSKIILKPYIQPILEQNTEKNKLNLEFVESLLQYCIKNKNPVAEVFIAEGADGSDSMELFNQQGYSKLAEQYSIGLIDLNSTEVEEVFNNKFLKFPQIIYPKVLRESFVISLANLSSSEELGIKGSLPNMLGAFPLPYYKGFFSKTKKRIRQFPLKYAIHDILLCKMPDFALIDASEKGVMLAGIPLEIDKQASKLLGIEWKNVPYLRLIEENIERFEPKKEKDDNLTQF